jgi:ribonuclease Z
LQCLLNRMDSFAFPLFAHADVTVHPDGPTIVANGVTMLTSEPLRCASLLAPRTAERERKAEAKRQRKQETTQASQHSKKPKPWRTQETEAETDSTPTAAAGQEDIAPLAATVPIEPEDAGSCILKAAIARLRESGQRQWTPVDVAGWQQLLQQVPGLADRLPPVEQHATLHQATSPCVLFLGTGSAIPSKYRNVTAMMLTIPAVAAYPAVSVLLDCGEGTVGQLQRMLGRAEASVHLSQLQLVHISHIHADHLLGLPGVLRARQQARQARSLPTAPLMVVGPKPLWQWLIAAGFVPGRDFMLTMNHNFFPEGVTASDHSVGTNATGQKMVARIQERLASLGIVRFATVPVIHCRFATGCVVEHASGWKLVWSGDTRPCPEIATMAQGADVLIHEATFDVDLIDEAKAKNHSTTPEAIDIANQAGVKALVLTHFSQRYPRVPKLDSSKPDNPAVVHPGMPTMIAFDTMRYSFQDAERLSLFVPALQHLFESLYPEDIERLEARQDGSA